MPGPTPLPVRLTNKQRAELRLLREDDDPRLCARAAIILACADGLSNSEVARRENTAPSTVAGWRRAFCADGITGLRDVPARVDRASLSNSRVTSGRLCCATSAASGMRRRIGSPPHPALSPELSLLHIFQRAWISR